MCDLFLGGFSSARVAVELGRRAAGFELSASLYRHGMEAMRDVQPGARLAALRRPSGDGHANQGRRWTRDERARLAARYQELRRNGATKKGSIALLCEEFGRGYFSILNVIDAPGA